MEPVKIPGKRNASQNPTVKDPIDLMYTLNQNLKVDRNEHIRIYIRDVMLYIY